MSAAGPATVSALEPATAALVSIAAGLHDSPESEIAALMEDARAAGARPEWLEELVLGSVLIVGFPRALVAASALRTVQPLRGDIGDAADYSRWKDWEARGEATCRIIYGAAYEKLRKNVKALHPALDAWVLMDGYGRTISRPALDLKRRELCAIAMLVPQGVLRQLHSHLKGALHAGANEAEVTEALEITARTPSINEERVNAARLLWKQIRELPAS